MPSSAAPAFPVATSIAAVTTVVPDLDAVVSAYVRWLRYRVEGRDAVSASEAARWGAPAMAGRRRAWLHPASGADVRLQFVEAPATAGSAALRTLGWNANEILVEDPDALEAELAGSPFLVIGRPEGLKMNPAVRAMQVLGPASELLYLTRVPPGKSLFALGSARSWVDRTFIVVVGGADVQALRAFYREALGLPVTDAVLTGVGVLNAAWGLPEGEHTRLAIARFPASFLVELDEYPPQAPPRPCRPGELPSGMALVTLRVSSLDAVRAPFVAPPGTAAAPYAGCRVGVVRGAAGELLELVEAPEPAAGPAGVPTAEDA